METEKPKKGEGDVYLRRKYIKIADAFIEDFIPHFKMFDLIGANPKKVFSKLFIEPHFPKDAKIVGVTFHYAYGLYEVTVESQSYPDVPLPTELTIVCHKDNIWNIPEKVEFD